MSSYGSLGKALGNEHRRRAAAVAEGARPEKAVGVGRGQDKKSVLEQSSLDDFCAMADLARATFEAERGRAEDFSTGATIVPPHRAPVSPAAGTPSSISVPIPWRPDWSEDMSAEELAHKEGEAFLEWRRGLAKIEEDAGLVMTPYEKNLDFWRQLWRTVDRSDLLVQILDARDPEFYRCQDLERYVSKFGGKRHLILLNKADFLSRDLRRNWRQHLEGRGCDVVLFSALRELHHQQRLPCGQDSPSVSSTAAASAEGSMTPHGCLLRDDPEVADCDQLMEELRRRLPEQVGAGAAGGVIGFVGYPNVGKSSVINALFGAKKVSMSRTPGKTKHLQTLELTGGLTLCDCPGLVFPSVVATKAHLATNGTAPLDELRDFIAPVRLVVLKLGVPAILEKYGLGSEAVRDGVARSGDREDPARSVLAALATARQHFLRLGVPDETWAARRVLRDYCTGALLHCEPPPGYLSAAPTAAGAAAAPTGAAGTPGTATLAVAELASAALVSAEGSESDFSDLDGFLRGDGAGAPVDGHASRRKARQQEKRTSRAALASR